MDRIDRVINWANIDALLMVHGDSERTKKEADACFSILLLKSMFLQKWFGIPSDPGLENQINDRISFKRLSGLSLDKLSTDHSAFSIFRSRFIQISNDKNEQCGL